MHGTWAHTNTRTMHGGGAELHAQVVEAVGRWALRYVAWLCGAPALCRIRASTAARCFVPTRVSHAGSTRSSENYVVASHAPPRQPRPRRVEQPDLLVVLS